MHPTINGKTLLECEEDAFSMILNNPDYRESEYLDYKAMFSVDCCKKSDERQRKISEFRSDICSFANSSGGYLILGVQEQKGIPTEINGIEIHDDDLDNYELRLKNYLQTIQPRIPKCSFRFIKLENGNHLVIIFVQHDSFAPYIHLENEKDYRAYKRVGNSKAVISYSELKNMFKQATVLEKEIDAYRRDRINYYREKTEYQGDHGSQFLMIHFFPDTYLDSNYNRPVFVINRSNYGLTSFFQPFSCNSRCIPTVEGIRSPNYNQYAECRLNNTGVAECVYSLVDQINYNVQGFQQGLFPYGSIWEVIKPAVSNYISDTCSILDIQRVYVCISIVGCDGVGTETDSFFMSQSCIDRDEMLCQPVVFDDVRNREAVEQDVSRLKLEFLLSIGVRTKQQIDNLIKKVYGS